MSICPSTIRTVFSDPVERGARARTFHSVPTIVRSVAEICTSLFFFGFRLWIYIPFCFVLFEVNVGFMSTNYFSLVLKLLIGLLINIIVKRWKVLLWRASSIHKIEGVFLTKTASLNYSISWDAQMVFKIRKNEPKCVEWITENRWLFFLDKPKVDNTV